MAQCTKIYRTSKRVCAGSLNSKGILYTRSIEAPSFGSVDFDENFSSPINVWAMIESVSGKTIFDGTNTEQLVTHNIYIRYRLDITTEDWFELISINSEANVYLNILKVENLNEDNRFLKLICNIRGDTSLSANLA